MIFWQIHKQTIHNLALTEQEFSEEEWLEHQSVLETTLKRFKAFNHFSIRYLICGIKVFFFLKNTPKNFACSTKGNGV